MKAGGLAGQVRESSPATAERAWRQLSRIRPRASKALRGARDRAPAAILALALFCSAGAHAAQAPSPARDPPQLPQVVRLSGHRLDRCHRNHGRAQRIAERIGYRPTITVLSVPVTFASLKNKDIDVFLGNWMPAAGGRSAQPTSPTARSWSCGANLDGRQVHPGGAGLHLRGRAQGLHRHSSASPPQLNDSIYGIEPGNDGNRLVLEDDQAEPIRPRRLQADRVERAGHAGAGGARLSRASSRSCSWRGSRIR